MLNVQLKLSTNWGQTYPKYEVGAGTVVCPPEVSPETSSDVVVLALSCTQLLAHSDDDPLQRLGTVLQDQMK